MERLTMMARAETRQGLAAMLEDAATLIEAGETSRGEERDGEGAAFLVTSGEPLEDSRPFDPALHYLATAPQLRAYARECGEMAQRVEDAEEDPDRDTAYKLSERVLILASMLSEQVEQRAAAEERAAQVRVEAHIGEAPIPRPADAVQLPDADGSAPAPAEYARALGPIDGSGAATTAMVDRAESWCVEHSVPQRHARDLANVFACWAAEFYQRGRAAQVRPSRQDTVPALYLAHFTAQATDAGDGGLLLRPISEAGEKIVADIDEAGVVEVMCGRAPSVVEEAPHGR